MLSEEQLHYFCEAEARLSGVCVRFFRDREGKELAAVYGNRTLGNDLNDIPRAISSLRERARSGLRTSNNSCWGASFPSTMNGRSSSGPCAWES